MEEAIEFFAYFKFKVKEGHHYLSSFIGSEVSTSEYVSENMQEWMASVNIVADMMPHQPQVAFNGFARLLQFEWAYMQQTMELSRDVFDLVEEVIYAKLLKHFLTHPKSHQTFAPSHPF
eukprot:14081423-Ditylum_brightwellii.AAC.1